MNILERALHHLTSAPDAKDLREAESRLLKEHDAALAAIDRLSAKRAELDSIETAHADSVAAGEPATGMSKSIEKLRGELRDAELQCDAFTRRHGAAWKAERALQTKSARAELVRLATSEDSLTKKIATWEAELTNARRDLDMLRSRREAVTEADAELSRDLEPIAAWGYFEDVLAKLRDVRCSANRRRVAELEREWRTGPGIHDVVVIFWPDTGEIVQAAVLSHGPRGGYERIVEGLPIDLNPAYQCRGAIEAAKVKRFGGTPDDSWSRTHAAKDGMGPMGFSGNFSPAAPAATVHHWGSDSPL